MTRIPQNTPPEPSADGETHSTFATSVDRHAAIFLGLTLALALGIGALVGASQRGWIRMEIPFEVTGITIFTPVVVAIILAVATDGYRGLKRLLRPLFTWQVPVRWYVFALLLPAFINTVSIAIYVGLGGSMPSVPGQVPADLDPFVTDHPALTVVLFASVFLLSAVAEEVGWRGYALPRLQRRLSALSSSLLIGVVWAFWHAPAHVVIGSAQGEIPFLWSVPSVIGIAIIITWMYNHTQGSLLLVTFLHASVQATNLLLPTLPGATGDVAVYQLSVVVTIGLALIVVIRSGSSLSPGDRPVTV